MAQVDDGVVTLTCNRGVSGYVFGISRPQCDSRLRQTYCLLTRGIQYTESCTYEGASHHVFGQGQQCALYEVVPSFATVLPGTNEGSPKHLFRLHERFHFTLVLGHSYDRYVVSLNRF